MFSLRFTFPFLFLMVFTSGSAQNSKKHISNIEATVYSTSERSIILDQYRLLLKSFDSLEQRSKVDIDTEIYLWTVKGFSEYKIGEFRESEASLIEALKVLDGNDDSNWRRLARIKTYNLLGLLKNNMVAYEKSINYYQKVLSLTEDTVYLARVYGNIGLAHKNLEEYDLAISQYEKALELAKDLNDPILIARLRDNLGQTQSILNLPRAEANLTRSLQIRDSLEFTQGQISSHLHLSEHYLRQKDLPLARFHSETALQISKESKLVPLELSALENLLGLEDEKNTRRFAFLTDSLNRVDQTSSNKFAEIRYGVTLKEREAEQLRIQNRYNFFIFATVILLVVLTSLLIYNRNKQRNKIAVINESIKTEKRISERIHDEIANDLYHTMLRLEKVTPENEIILDDLDHIYNRVRDISSDNSPLNPEADFSIVVEDLFFVYKNPEVNILTLNLKKVDWSILKAHKKTNLYRVLQELLTNMKKHSGASHVVFIFSQSQETIQISYQDNGIGSDILKGNGLLNIKNRIASIDGSVTFESEKGHGFKASIII